MGLEIIDCEQGSEGWHRARLGIPTSSEFKTLIGIKKDAREKVTRRTYMMKLAAEIIRDEPMEGWENEHMTRGKEQEDEARNLYAFMTDADPQRVGFVVNGKKGCSPDSLIGDKGMLEIKSQLSHLLLDRILKDEFPSDHKAQCQGALWVCEREWIDIAIYCPKLPLFIKRAYRDPGFIRDLSQAVDDFNCELAEMVERVRRYGTPMREAA